MSYDFIKAKGRVSFFKDGEFDHQQFRPHWGFRDPAAYIAHLVELDAEAEAYRLAERAARVEKVRAWQAERAERAAAEPQFAF